MVDMIGKQPGQDALAEVASGFIEDAQSDNIVEAGAKIAEAQDNAFEAQRETPVNVAIRANRDDKIKPHTTTVKKTKEAKEAQVKLIPLQDLEDAAGRFARQNPQFTKQQLLDLTEKLQKELKEGFTKKDLLDLIQKEYPDFKDAGLALDFLISVSLEDFKELLIDCKNDLKTAESNYLLETQKQREAEVAKRVEAEAAEAIKSSEAATKIAHGGDLHNLSKHLLEHPIESTLLFKALDDAYGNKIQTIELALIKNWGSRISELKNIDDKESKAEHAINLKLMRSTRSLLFAEKFFENNPRNLKNDGKN